jgi:periplasmic protein CpxP/Spy
MKKMLMFLSLVMLVQLTFAQGNGKANEEKADKKTAQLTKELTLTTAQQAKVKAIILDHLQKMDAVKAKYASSSNRSGMPQEMKAVNEHGDAELKRIFTPAQNAKFKGSGGEGKDEEKKKK